MRQCGGSVVVIVRVLTRGETIIGDVGSYVVSGVHWRERWRRSLLRFPVAGGVSLDVVIVVDSSNSVKVTGSWIWTSSGRRRSGHIDLFILLPGGLGCWGDRWNLLVSGKKIFFVTNTCSQLLFNESYIIIHSRIIVPLLGFRWVSHKIYKLGVYIIIYHSVIIMKLM